MNLAKLVSIGIALLLIQACSHPIEIVGEGDVRSASGDRNCSLEQYRASDTHCSKNYAIGAYQETYYPEPRTGWRFARWEPYCTTAPAPNYECSFSATAEQVKKFWGQTMPPLKAVFVTQCGDGIMAGTEQCDDGNVDSGDGCESTCTLPGGDLDIVTAGGKQWLQPKLFTNLSWDDMENGCSPNTNGVCAAGSVLNGIDVAGWTWASSSDVATLFNLYGIVPPLSLEVVLQNLNKRDEVDSLWAPAFFADGWLPTFDDPGGAVDATYGYTRDIGINSFNANPFPVRYYSVMWLKFAVTGCCLWDTASVHQEIPYPSDTIGGESMGGWFFRLDPVP